MSEILSIQIVVIAIAGIVAQWTAWRTHIPAIVFLLALGFLLGPVSGVVQPELLLGDLLKPAIASAVAIILFEGSLQLHFRELRETRWAVRHVIFLGAPLGWAAISAAAYYIAGLDWPVAVTLGGMLIVTGPTVIMPLLRQARLNPRVGSLLKWEGIVNDPVGVIFAILAYEYFVATKSGAAGRDFFIVHGMELAGIVGLSFMLAHAVKRIFARGYMPEYLKTPFLLSVVLSLFFICDLILHESGLIAVTVLGLTLTNIHTASLEEIKRFKESITILLVSGVFILLTAGMDISVLLTIGFRDILFVAALLFIIRPLVIFLSTVDTEATRQEVFLAGLIAPRGIVCAAMAGVIGPLLVEAGFPDGEKILPLCFTVVILSVVLHSFIIKPLALRLKLTTTETNGVIIAGAHPWSIQLASVLKSRDVPVMLVDNDWFALKEARLSDVPVYYGELLSDETEFALEFNKYNTLVAATHSAAYNALLCENFGHDYGKERVFRLNLDDRELSGRRRIAVYIQGRPFISGETSLNLIETRFEEGWRFRSTRVGKAKDGPLIVPEAGEERYLVGRISKSGLVSLFSKPVQIAAVREGDFVLVFSAEAEKGDVDKEAEPLPQI